MDRDPAPIYPVTPQLAAHMREHAAAVEAEARSLAYHRSRDPGGDYAGHVHTALGPIALRWKPLNPKASATLRMGPLATATSPDAGLPHLDQGTLVLGRDALAGLPETLWEALLGRRLGELLTYPNPFVARLSDLRIRGTLRLVSTLHVHLDVDLVDWTEGDGFFGTKEKSDG